MKSIRSNVAGADKEKPEDVRPGLACLTEKWHLFIMYLIIRRRSYYL